MHKSCVCSKQLIKQWFYNNILMVATICAVILGIILGFALRELHLSENAILWIGIWGELFLRMLKMIILPLIICCMVVGVASMEGSASGKLGGITLAYIFLTQLVSVTIGAILTAAIKPGAGFTDLPPSGLTTAKISYSDVFTDLLRNLLPDNIIQACLETTYTDSHTVNRTVSLTANTSSLETVIIKKIKDRDGMNIMGIVVFSLLLGLATTASGETGKPLYRFFVSLNNVITKMMNGILWYSPIGILSLTMSALLKVEHLAEALHAVGLLVGTVIAGLMIHQLVVIPTLFTAICRRNPFTYIWQIVDAYLAGSSTASSAVAMPYLLKTLPEKLKVDKHITQYVVPIEITLNKDGSALYIMVATMFIAQSYSVVLSMGQQVVLVFLVSILVAAVAVVPSASIVVLIMVSSSIGLPVGERIGLLMSVEWLLDRIRTGTNIVSHAYGCGIVERLSKISIPSMKETNTEIVELNTTVSEIDPETLQLFGYAMTQEGLNGQMMRNLNEPDTGLVDKCDRGYVQYKL